MRRLVALLAATVVLGGCAPSFPPTAAAYGGDAGFKAMMAIRYPPGSPAAILREDLAREGYGIRDDGSARHEAVWEGGNLPCYSRVRVIWTEDRRGRVGSLGAERHDCS